jgi:uncharacterized radical SAM protein YgiQ
VSLNPELWLPTTADEIRARGWEAPDVAFVTGDAYVDHPSFAMAVLSRVLEWHGFRVAILPQPDRRSATAWRALGRPRLFYAVSGGNMDSMINHYTANKKRRNDDAYSPGGRIGLRPDRPTRVYAQRCREAFPGVPVVIGGIEAPLRRIAHFDYWSEQVRPSMLAPTCLSSARARRRSSPSRAGSPPDSRWRRCATCAAWRTCSPPGRRGRPGPTRRSRCRPWRT